MPPPKKAAKKAAKKTAKKAAKKTAGHHHDQHHQAKDLRRAFEHMGRLEVLRGSLESSALEPVSALTKLARSEIKVGYNQSAADLLRASEHLSFAVLADPGGAGGGISTELKSSIQAHFDELLRKAGDHWEGDEQQSGILTALYRSSRAQAAEAFKDGAYHRALEFARAAEALAHVRQMGQPQLETGARALRLKGAH